MKEVVGWVGEGKEEKTGRWRMASAERARVRAARRQAPPACAPRGEGVPDPRIPLAFRSSSPHRLRRLMRVTRSVAPPEVAPPRPACAPHVVRPLARDNPKKRLESLPNRFRKFSPPKRLRLRRLGTFGRGCGLGAVPAGWPRGRLRRAASWDAPSSVRRGDPAPSRDWNWSRVIELNLKQLTSKLKNESETGTANAPFPQVDRSIDRSANLQDTRGARRTTIII